MRNEPYWPRESNAPLAFKIVEGIEYGWFLSKICRNSVKISRGQSIGREVGNDRVLVPTP